MAIFTDEELCRSGAPLCQIEAAASARARVDDRDGNQLLNRSLDCDVICQYLHRGYNVRRFGKKLYLDSLIKLQVFNSEDYAHSLAKSQYYWKWHIF